MELQALHKTVGHGSDARGSESVNRDPQSDMIDGVLAT